MAASIYDRIAEARRTLMRAGLRSNDAAIDAEVLARHALGWDRARLLADGRDPAPAGFDDEFAPMIDRRARREPVAFITGSREFWGLDFEVSRDVLIPRPETEMIVESVCDAYPTRRGVRLMVDVGTGSGCLAVALAREFPETHFVAVDISAAAIAVARRNAARHGVGSRIHFVRGDLLEALRLRADVIVSNPPYVPMNVQLARDVAQYEPAVALYSGEEGLTAVARLVSSARDRLADNGLFVFEFGLGQEERVRELASLSGWRSVALRYDLQSIPRTAIMRAER